VSAFSRGRPGMALVAPALALLLAACTPAADRSTPRPDPSPQRPVGAGGITFGVIGEPATLNPYSPDASDLTYALVRPVYPSLFRLLPTGEPRPSLALSLDETKSGARVRLREATWSNGRPITAADVVASIRRARPPSGFARITGARAHGRRTVVLRGTVGDWPETLATAAFVVPREGLRVSGGPYRVVSRTPGLEVVYRRNPRWWGSAPRLERVSVQYAANLDIMLGLLRRGEFDAAAPLSTLGLDVRLEAARLRGSSARGWESILLDFSRSDLPRSERVGVARALDRSALVDVFVRHDGRASFSLNPEPGPAGAGGPWARSLGPARPTGQIVEIAAPRDDELLGLLQEALYRQLETAGIAAELTSIDGSEYYGGWLEQEAVDIALRRRAGAPGKSQGREAFRDFDALPFAHVDSVVAWRPGLEGLRPNPTFEGPLWNLERWHVAEPR
jgi:Bacterial extracellular solute-binding proteins, family 5 Middle